MIKNHEIIDRTNDILQYVLGTFKDFDIKADQRSISLRTMEITSDVGWNDGIDVAIKTLQLLKETVSDNDYGTRAKYFKEVVVYALESYTNNLHGCEYCTDEQVDSIDG